jgi:hypothetical protein
MILLHVDWLVITYSSPGRKRLRNVRHEVDSGWIVQGILVLSMHIHIQSWQSNEQTFGFFHRRQCNWYFWVTPRRYVVRQFFDIPKAGG